jgi:hypothetical protein
MAQGELARDWRGCELRLPTPDPSRKRAGDCVALSSPLPLAGRVGGGPAVKKSAVLHAPRLQHPRRSFTPLNHRENTPSGETFT